MTTYQVTAERGSIKGRWVLQCVEHPGAISETTRLSEAPELMREMIAFVAGVDPSTIEINLRPVLPAGLEVKLNGAKLAAREAEKRQREAAALSRGVVHALKAEGWSGADVAVTLGVSPQRVSQLSKN